jgi:hypothetical protein
MMMGLPMIGRFCHLVRTNRAIITTAVSFSKSARHHGLSFGCKHLSVMMGDVHALPYTDLNYSGNDSSYSDE